MKQFEIDAIAKMVARALATESEKFEARLSALNQVIQDQASQIEVLKSAISVQNLSIEVAAQEVAVLRESMPVMPEMPDMDQYSTRAFAMSLVNDALDHMGERVKAVSEKIPYYDDDFIKLRSLIEDYRVVLPDMGEYVLKTELTSKLHQVEYNYKMNCDEVEVSAQTMVELAVINLNEIIESKNAEVQSKFDSLALTVDINGIETPYYEEGEVVRAGAIRRFGVGGLSMAAVDTARGPHAAPGDWRMIQDGHTPVPVPDGVLYRSLSGKTDFTIKHGVSGQDGKEGQRGKTGGQGAPGVPGVGVSTVEITENGMAVVLSTGAVHAFNFEEPLAHAINEVSGLIDYKIEKQVVKLLSKGE